MVLKLVKGCICDSMTVDDIEEIDLTDEQREKVIETIMKNLKPEDLNYLLQKTIPLFAQEEHFDDEPCECCGDYVEEYIWTIDDVN